MRRLSTDRVNVGDTTVEEGSAQAGSRVSGEESRRRERGARVKKMPAGALDVSNVAGFREDWNAPNRSPDRVAGGSNDGGAGERGVCSSAKLMH